MPDKEVADARAAHLFQRRVLPWTQLLGYVPDARPPAPSPGDGRVAGARSGMPVDPDRIVLTAGAQHAIATALSALAQAGRHAARRGADLLGRRGCSRNRCT